MPFSYLAAGASAPRAKIGFETLEAAREAADRLATAAGLDYDVPTLEEYPKELDAAIEHFWLPFEGEDDEGWRTIDIYGDEAQAFLDAVLPSDVLSLGVDQYQPTRVLNPDGSLLANGVLHRLHANAYHLHVDRAAGRVRRWLTALSDGFVDFDPYDRPRAAGSGQRQPDGRRAGYELCRRRFSDELAGFTRARRLFAGARARGPLSGRLPVFTWEPADQPLKTSLHALHKELGAVPFAGYDMPVWYTSVGAEHGRDAHRRRGAGRPHMGVFASGGRAPRRSSTR